MTAADWLFSHEQTVLLTGVSDDILHSWVRRGLIKPAVASTGRGVRRKYDQLTLIQIQVLRHFSSVDGHLALGRMVMDRLEPLARELVTRFTAEDAGPFLFSDPVDSDFCRQGVWRIDRRRSRTERAQEVDDSGKVIRTRNLTFLMLGLWVDVGFLLNRWVDLLLSAERELRKPRKPRKPRGKGARP